MGNFMTPVTAIQPEVMEVWGNGILCHVDVLPENWSTDLQILTRSNLSTPGRFLYFKRKQARPANQQQLPRFQPCKTKKQRFRTWIYNVFVAFLAYLCLLQMPKTFGHAVDGWNPAITSWYGKSPHYLQGFIHLRWLGMGFLNHQQ